APAVRLWQRSLAAQEAARFRRAGTGFDRALAQAGAISPRTALAAGLARLGQARNAFAHAEAGLARGLLDDLESPGNPDVARLETLDAALVALAALPEGEQPGRAERTLREHRAVTAELTDLVAADSARRVLPLERIQKAISDDAALVLWVGADERWGCVVRS